jgi:hypothetical protein
MIEASRKDAKTLRAFIRSSYVSLASDAGISPLDLKDKGVQEAGPSNKKNNILRSQGLFSILPLHK